MRLCKEDILAYMEAGKIVIEPFNRRKQMSSVSVDLRLGNQFSIFKTMGAPVIDLRETDLKAEMDRYMVKAGEGLVLVPHKLVLGVTLERVVLPNDIVGRLTGKSSLGRCGVSIHVTADRVDPGWKGQLTLEIVNVIDTPIRIYPGMNICALEFTPVSKPTKGYRGKYFGARGLMVSKIGQEFEPAKLLRGNGELRTRSRVKS